MAVLESMKPSVQLVIPGDGAGTGAAGAGIGAELDVLVIGAVVAVGALAAPEATWHVADAHPLCA